MESSVAISQPVCLPELPGHLNVLGCGYLGGEVGTAGLGCDHGQDRPLGWMGGSKHRQKEPEQAYTDGRTRTTDAAQRAQTLLKAGERLGSLQITSRVLVGTVAAEVKGLNTHAPQRRNLYHVLLNSNTPNPANPVIYFRAENSADAFQALIPKTTV